MDRYRIEPGSKVDLAARDADDKSLWTGAKKDGKDRAREINERLEALQELLYAEGKQRILVVLQAMDTAGKDSTIRHVFEGTNPQGVKVRSFKKPTAPELAHDYLWRVHPHVPGNGEITIFNRSHYEDVLVVRIHSLVPEERWRRRYEHIRAFEKMLADEGTVIRKFFLHISKEEQRSRLQQRLDRPEKNWKFDPADLKERKRWDDYMVAYEEAMQQTSTEWAPWYVVPANSKWYRNLVVGQILVDTLESLDMKYPAAPSDIRSLTVT